MNTGSTRQSRPQKYLVQIRVAHFPAGKRETGNGNREISRREMGFFPGNFPVLAKIGLKWARNGQI